MKRVLGVVTTVALLLSVLPLMTVSATATAWDFARLEGYYKTQGRVCLNGTALEMDTTSSGFEFYFEGSGDVVLNAQIRCTYSTDMYLTVIVDGVRSRMQLDAVTKGVNKNKTVTLASGLANGIHHIEVYKQSEAIVSSMKALTVTFDGVPLATPPMDKITMEVVGDSISSGASMWSAATHNDAIPADYPYYLDGTKTYAYLAGEAIGANVRVTQASGYGCVDGYNADGLNLQDLYPYTNYWRDSTALYSFDPPADIVVINLGTNDGMSGKVTDAQFKAGVLNLMTMARAKNPGAKVVWCTGMMGTFFPTVIQEAVAELGGAASGYFYCPLPYGADGGYAHPNVAQHATAANVLKNFLLENCLPADHLNDFASAQELSALVSKAEAVSAPSAALQSALKWAKAELAWGTTDAYRLGVRYQTLQAAMTNAVSFDLMPKQYIATCPLETNGSYVWPYYGAGDGSVTLYKGGEGYYWPRIETLVAPQTVNVNETPYLRLVSDGTAYLNIHLSYRDASGTDRVVTASELAGNGAIDFSPGKLDLVIDLRTYIEQQNHADRNGNIVLTACNIYASGNMDDYAILRTCAIVSSDGADAPTAISGNFPVKDGILFGVSGGTTAAQLLEQMNDSAYLVVKNADGTAASGTLATGMTLALVVNGVTVDEATIAVTGDTTGDGVVNTTDCRIMLSYFAGVRDCTALQLAAADADCDGTAETSDVRDILMSCLGA
ncbi:MAG: hypothetical protein IKV35_05175 [Clostridia bacterium]|nr:hypothetical protein [Clostridia bacterium]